MITRRHLVLLLALAALAAFVLPIGTAGAANPVVSLSKTVINVTEGNSGTANATVVASLSASSTSTVTVAYTTVDGTAKVSDSDYIAKSGTLTFNPGATSQSISVQAKGDTKLENYETFSVKLSNPTNATLSSPTEKVQILNDEKPKLSLGNIKVAEGQTAAFKPKLLQAYYQPITLTAATSNATATAPADYTAVNTPVTFAAGSKTAASVNVPTATDNLAEPNETFKLAVSGGGVVAAVTRTGTITNASTSQFCQGSAAPAHYQHVVLVVMENKNYNDVIGSTSAPWTTNLARSCASATAYAQAASPSRPNYIAMTAGSVFNCAGSNGDPSEGSCSPTSPSVFKQVINAGGTAASYAEGMNGNCDVSSHGNYAVKHNPWPYYATEAALCQQFNKPLPASIDVAHLPTLLTIYPDLCHDMHDCSVATGDSWLSQYLQPVLDSPAYLDGSTAVIVTWDEYTNLPNAFASMSVTPGTTVTAATTHYALLRTIEDMLGLSPLGQAATATSLRPSMHL